MAERQIHGFNFENYIKQKFNISECPEGHYTYKWDGILNGYPVSIKTEKVGSDIEMASFLRNAENNNDFYLIVGFWEENKNNIISIETLFIKGSEWHKLFDMSLVYKCQELINTITNDISDDELNALYITISALPKYTSSAKAKMMDIVKTSSEATNRNILGLLER